FPIASEPCPCINYRAALFDRYRVPRPLYLGKLDLLEDVSLCAWPSEIVSQSGRSTSVRDVRVGRAGKPIRRVRSKKPSTPSFVSLHIAAPAAICASWTRGRNQK